MKKTILSLSALLATIAGVIFVGGGDPGRKIILAWDPNPASDNVTGYHVYLQTNGVTFETNTMRIAVPATNDPPCVRIEGMPSSEWYCLAVTATNAWGESDLSRKYVYFAPGDATNVGVSWRFERKPKQPYFHEEYGHVSTVGDLILETPVEPGYTYWVAENLNGDTSRDCDCLPDSFEHTHDMHFQKAFLDLYIGAPPSNSLLRITLPALTSPRVKGMNYRVWRSTGGPVITNVNNTFARFL